jgi:hypothetical protein
MSKISSAYLVSTTNSHTVKLYTNVSNEIGSFYLSDLYLEI